MASRPGRILPVLALAAICLLSASDTLAQADDGEPGTLVLRDLEHPLNGTWVVTHGAGTMNCPAGISTAIPGGDPETVQVEVYDGGHRLEMRSPNGSMTMRSVGVDEWESETEGERQILRKKVRDDASWFAWAVDGAMTVYEGVQNPIPEITIHYIMGFDPEEPSRMNGHLRSSAKGCNILRGFSMRKQG